MPTGVLSSSVMIRASQHQTEEKFLDSPPFCRGIAGGVVSQPYFEEHFGIINPSGSVNKSKDVTISSNVVSVLQAGAFFGALGSAPISGRQRFCASCTRADVVIFLQRILDVDGRLSALPSCFASVP